MVVYVQVFSVSSSRSRREWLLLGIWFTHVVGDSLTTVLMMYEVGLGAEANVLVRALWRIDPVVVPAVMVGGFAALVGVVRVLESSGWDRRGVDVWLVGILMVGVLVCVNNLHHLSGRLV